MPKKKLKKIIVQLNPDCFGDGACQFGYLGTATDIDTVLDETSKIYKFLWTRNIEECGWVNDWMPFEDFPQLLTAWEVKEWPKGPGLAKLVKNVRII